MRHLAAPVSTRAAALRLAALAAASCPLWQTPLLSVADANMPPNAAAAVRTRSGVRYIDFQEGTGPTPRFGQLIRFHYTGYTVSRDESNSATLKAFDSTYERGRQPYFTKHGNGLTCQGLEEALHTMRVGGRRRVIVPPAFGYTGDKGPFPPGPNAREQLFDAVGANRNVYFDVELLSAADDLLDRGDYDDLDETEAGEAARAAIQMAESRAQTAT